MRVYTILIIDDLIENLKTINAIFEEYRPEYNILQTNSANAALKILNRNIPDIIITDWDMPGMNGIEFIVKLKSRKRVPNIFVTVKLWSMQL